MATFGQLVQFGPFFRSGVLVSDLDVYHYTAGTLTLLNVYTDRAKSTPAAQPVSSDSNGIVSFYADGIYKFIIKDGSDNTTLYTYDNWNVADNSGALSGEGAALTAASTLTLGTDGNQFHVAGSTGIAALSGTQPEVTLIFDSTPTLTHSGNLILQGAANYTCVAGDAFVFMNEGAGVWREINRYSYPIAGDASITVVTPSTLRASGYAQDFRLSLTTATPVTTGDVTGAGTLYCVPYVGNRITLYDGTRWNTRTSAEFSLALTLTSGKPYDVFCYDNSGTPTLETLIWTNDTTRATALAYQNGVLVKSGAATRRYLGSLYASGSNTTEDSVTNRYLFNYYHQKDRNTLTTFSTDRTTTSTTYVEINSEIRGSFILGVSEDAVFASTSGTSSSSTNDNTVTAIAFDGTTAEGGFETAGFANGNDRSVNQAVSGYKIGLAAGKHYATVIGKTASGTATWRSSTASTATTTTYAKFYLHTRIRG